ncbi:uncharacterized protein LOC124158929 [Ischnura elegans]|uniref:uncharacterized protein LOC124158929 n=1 Tax=Ischnura elegans TaxID=197161 RepID=UPI001ED8ADA8|nr:uncharacterized protein LOC124158929 [Ischnura elegans]
MAKDFNIVFVYDTQRCQKEDDDPQDALLYFHPGWVSDQQRIALAGQLMGAAHFFLSTFSCPKVLTLQRGKFVVRQFGRYILAVGTDSGTPDWLLQMQAASLESTIGFYHKDLETIALNAAASVPMPSSPGNGSEDHDQEAGSSKDLTRQSELEYEQRAALAERLTQMLDVYVPVLQCASSPFSHVPTVLLPKSASNTFLEAFHILQCCQAKSGVLGGVILYQNKVVATQLSTEVTKRLVYTDPFRIKSPAESVCGAFRPPIGVQLLRVYIRGQELKRLHSLVDSAQESFSSVSSLQPAPRKVSVPKALPSKEPQPTMKRDPSRILSVLEEGEGENDIGGESPMPRRKNWSNGSPGPVSPSKVLLEQVISICKAGLAGISSQKSSVDEREEEANDISPIQNNHFYKERSHSLDDMKVRPFPMHHHAFGIPRHEFLSSMESGSPQKDDLDEEIVGKGSWPGSKGHNSRLGKKVFNTITDPFYPVFRSDGLPMSRAMFDECIEIHYQALKHDKKTPELKNQKNVAKKVSEKKRDVKFSKEVVAKPVQAEVSEASSGLSPVESVDRSKQEQYRRSLSLPIKSFALDGEESIEKDEKALQRRARAASECPGFVPTPGPEQTPLSPLLLPSGLPIPLNLEKFARGPIPETPKDSESGSKVLGSSSVVSTIAAKSSKGSAVGKFSKEKKLVNGDNAVDDKLEAVVLYVYGQHDMSLMLIMDDGRESDPELVHSLWEMCEEGLGGLESQLARCLEHHQTVGGASGGGIGVGEMGFSSGLGVGELGEGGAYGFLSFDPTGETLQCGGSRPWGAPEAEVAQQLHAHFRSMPGLTEVVVRCEDYTVYGCQCCRSEVFYQQPAGNKAGLPAPSDLMGVVPLKARRRLERDYGIVLL